MFTICRAPLPESYLLVVASDPHADDPDALPRALHRAGRSGKEAVWLDCSLLAPKDVSADTGMLLCAYGEAFAAQGIAMVVAHACPELRQALTAAGSPSVVRLVSSLVDAPDGAGPVLAPPLKTTQATNSGYKPLAAQAHMA